MTLVAKEIVVQDFHLEPVGAEGDCAVLRVTGEIDAYTAPKLRERIAQLLAAGSSHVIGDLRGVEFLDSTGLGALVGGLKRLRESDGSLHLAIGSDRIVRLFRITGLDSAFAIHPTVLEAIAADPYWRQTLEGAGHDSEKWCREHGLL